MDPQSQSTSLQRLQNVEKRIVRVLELAGGVMEEMGNPSGPRKELVSSSCSEFMQLVKTPILWSCGAADRTFLYERGQEAPPPSLKKLAGVSMN